MTNLKIIFPNEDQLTIGNFTILFYWETELIRKVNGLNLEWVGGWTYETKPGNDGYFENSKEYIYLERIAKNLTYTKKNYVDDIRKAMKLEPYKE
jgi:hypothetical protein